MESLWHMFETAVSVGGAIGGAVWYLSKKLKQLAASQADAFEAVHDELSDLRYEMMSHTHNSVSRKRSGKHV